MYIYSTPNEKIREKYCDLAQLHTYLSLLRLPVELRLPITKVRTISGYYDDLDALVSTCKYLSGNSYKNAKIETIYTTLNPFNPDLVARSCNRLTDYAKKHHQRQGHSQAPLAATGR